MGDRANCIVTQQYPNNSSKPAPVYLYTHWGGYELPAMVQKALQRKQRWNDPPYLARIIFDQMTAGEQGKVTGHGISTILCDNEHPLIVVDSAASEVRFESDQVREVLARYTFEEYCALENPKYPETM